MFLFCNLPVHVLCPFNHFINLILEYVLLKQALKALKKKIPGVLHTHTESEGPMFRLNNPLDLETIDLDHQNKFVTLNIYKCKAALPTKLNGCNILCIKIF